MAPRLTAAPTAAEAGDAGADHHDLGGRHLAGGGDLAGEEAAELVGRFDNGPVAADIGHGAERIQFLRARNARHGIHRKDGRLARRQPFHQRFVLGRPDEADQRAAFLQQVGLVGAVLRVFFGRPHLHHDVGLPDLCRRPADLRAGLAIGGVGEFGRFAGAGLHGHVEAQLDDLRHRLRGGGAAHLALVDFLRNPDRHRHADGLPRIASASVQVLKLAAVRIRRRDPAYRGRTAAPQTDKWSHAAGWQRRRAPLTTVLEPALRNARRGRRRRGRLRASFRRASGAGRRCA